MTDDRHRIIHVSLDERTIVRRSPEIEHERAAAIFDLLDDNRFGLQGAEGPYRLHLAVEDNRLLLDIADAEDQPLDRVTVPLVSLRGTIRDYFLVCDSYYAAIRRSASLTQIEAIDMGRRGLHDDGSARLADLLADRVTVDHATARRLFTLVCVLHLRG